MKMKHGLKISVALGLCFLVIGILGNAWSLGISTPILKIFVSGLDLLFLGTGILLLTYQEKIIKEVLLLFGTLLCCFIIAESYYRIFDPFPYVGWWEINYNEYGNLLKYDRILGWSGIPNETAEFITENSKTLLQHNEFGFRDVSHRGDQKKPAIVFLGDSFAWGYELNWDEMFVNMLRKKLPNYEIFNLSLRGYGTDQELIAFKRWQYQGPVKFVIVMFNVTDFVDNSRFIRYGRFKPKFEVRDGTLFLTHVPVIEIKRWQTEKDLARPQPSLQDRLKGLIRQSHFINEICFRVSHLKQFKKQKPNWDFSQIEKKEDNLTSQILQGLNQDVTSRGAQLVVMAIPAKEQFLAKGEYVPYQSRVEKICRALNVTYVDLAPVLKRSVSRPYFRYGAHWNKHGNVIIANTIYDYLKKRL